MHALPRRVKLRRLVGFVWCLALRGNYFGRVVERDGLGYPTQIMPINRKYQLGALLDACRRYPLRPWERLTFEYVLLGGVKSRETIDRALAAFEKVGKKMGVLKG